MKKILFLLIPIAISAQNTTIGGWKNYLSYNSPTYIADIDNKIYCVANHGLFSVSKTGGNIRRVSKVNGLSDTKIRHVSCSKNKDIIVIIYENCNIDLIKKNTIINISSIKEKEIGGNKKINAVTIVDELAFLSCSFGLVVLDLEKEEVKDTYYTQTGGQLEVNNCVLLGDSIVIATTGGLYFANSNSTNLSDFNNWTLFHNDYDTYKNLLIYNDSIYVDTNRETVSNYYNTNISTLITSTRNSIKIFRNNSEEILSHEKMQNINYALIDDNKKIWVADSLNGLLCFIDQTLYAIYVPQGPVENRIFSVDHFFETTYICHGGHINFGPLWNKNGVSIKDIYDGWRNYNYYNLKYARDIVQVARNNNKTYFASYYNGVAEEIDGVITELYSWYNTNCGLDTVSDWQNDNRMAIADLKFDKQGNMWGLVSDVDEPLFVKTTNNLWYKFMLSSVQKFHFDEILIDNLNQKWGIIGRNNGLFVYNDNNTITNTTDDQYKLLNSNVGNGALPSMNIYSFANDLDGEVWVGTDKGIAVFYNPELVFSNSNFDSQQILISEGEYGQYLLSEEKIKCIAVDGANRKWIGTEKSGIFLLSEDGTKEILHFTQYNSPLFSNNIIDICINHDNGEVFIATENGLLSYRSTATEGAQKQGQTTIFPNPVKESYFGPIAINGLVADANIKITDIDGNLVFEGFAKGGQAIWDGKNYNNKRVSTGVYLVFSSDVQGNEKIVSKILFIK